VSNSEEFRKEMAKVQVAPLDSDDRVDFDVQTPLVRISSEDA
jgi:hypothetical protein